MECIKIRESFPGWPKECGADLDGDEFLYHGYPVVINYQNIWFDAFRNGGKAIAAKVFPNLSDEEIEHFCDNIMSSDPSKVMEAKKLIAVFA